jgi:hypothetical protein
MADDKVRAERPVAASQEFDVCQSLPQKAHENEKAPLVHCQRGFFRDFFKIYVR